MALFCNIAHISLHQDQLACLYMGCECDEFRQNRSMTIMAAVNTIPARLASLGLGVLRGMLEVVECTKLDWTTKSRHHSWSGTNYFTTPCESRQAHRRLRSAITKHKLSQVEHGAVSAGHAGSHSTHHSCKFTTGPPPYQVQAGTLESNATPTHGHPRSRTKPKLQKIRSVALSCWPLMT